MPIDITEYQEVGISLLGRQIAAGQEPAIRTQQVAIGSGSAQSAVFTDVTRFVRVHADANCRIAFGPDPTALSSSQRIPAGGTEYFGVRPGHKLAVIESP